MTESITQKDLGVSSRALAIARLVDRLSDGDWSISIKKDEIAGIKEFSIGRVQTVTKRNFDVTENTTEVDTLVISQT